MSSSKGYLEYILEQLAELEDISHRAMMGEFILYYRGKIIGGVYDDRFLVKPTKSAVMLLPDAKYEKPYDGAKDMILVPDPDNKAFLNELINAIYNDLNKKKER